MSALSSKESSGFKNGSTPRPEGALVEEYAGPTKKRSREANPSSARKRTRRGSSMIGLDDSLGDSGGTEGKFKIVRATAKLTLEPWLVLPKGKHKGDECGGAKNGCPVCKLRYNLVVTQCSCARGINLAMREYWRIDSQMLDNFVREHGRVPRGKEWDDVWVSIDMKKDPDLVAAFEKKHGRKPNGKKEWKTVERENPYKVNAYKLIQETEPNLQSGISASLQQKAMKKWKKVRHETLVKNESKPPHYKNTMPIPIRGADFSIVKHKESSYDIRFSLSPGVHKCGNVRKEYVVPIKAYDHVQRESLDKISSGEWKQGEMTLEQDKRKRGAWYCKIAYTRFVPIVPESERMAAINKGIICNLAAVTYDDRQKIDDGDDIEDHLKQIYKRRKKYQYQSKLSGRKGHGKTRILQPIEKLQQKSRRWRESRLQNTARELALWFKKKDISVVFIEDFTAIRDGNPDLLKGGKYTWDRIQTWPYYEQQTRLISCLEELGIQHHIRPAKNISRKCPKCGHVHDEVPIKKDRTFVCQKCTFKRHIDVTAAMNVLNEGREWLSNGGGDDGEDGGKTKDKKSKKKTARKKKGK